MTHYYFVGIGGIGMSGLARYFHAHGAAVSGYDRTATPLTASLQALGISVCTSATASEVLADFEAWLGRTSLDECAVIRTPAVPSDFPVLVAAQKAKCTVLKRSQLLGKLTRDHPTLAVAGTHGKTTTSAILAHLMMGHSEGCRAFLGGILSDQQSNAIWSENAQWTVVEADEFDRSFLELNPTHAVITSADLDHMDIYEDADQFHKGFKDFAKRVSGRIFLEESVDIPGLDGQRYGIVNDEDNTHSLHIAAIHPRIVDGWMVADVAMNHAIHAHVKFPMPGKHNVLNALAAIALATESGIHIEDCLARLNSFSGIERRFNYHIRAPHGAYIDDYAHHPAELEAAISAARLHHPGKEITGIFQPHLFSRTRDHMVEFGQALALLDRVFLLPIYPAREAPIPGIDSQVLFENIPHTRKHLIESYQIFDNLKEHPPEVLLSLGAGDIDRIVKPLTNWLREDAHRFKYTT